ncbi:MAG: hypothetical protein HYV35_12105, partial [Lentisphaerae bacterium]|nr:hypothetical protein [Lentisphaerota bacterium]
MKRDIILTCSIMGVIFGLILAGYASAQQALDTETKLKQTKISIKFRGPMFLGDLTKFLTDQAKCDLSFQTQNDGGQAGSIPATGRTQDIDVVIIKTNNNVEVAQVAVSNVTAFDLMDTVVKKAGLTWRLSETGVVIVMPTNSICSGIKKCFEELKDFNEHYGRPKSLSTDQVKSYVCTNDYTSVISDANNYHVWASHWIEQRRGERPAYMAILDKMGGCTFEYSIYIVSASLPYNIKKMFDGPDAGASALRVSPRGVVGSPVWDRLGERIAYVRVSEDKKDGNIVILNVKTGRETIYSGLGIRPVPAYWPEISWDESGRLIAFKDEKDRICLLDLKDQTYREVCQGNFMPASASLSPDGKYICFINDFSSVVSNSQSLTISYQNQQVQEPEGGAPVVCLETNIYEMDKWTMNIVNIQE